MSDLEEIDVEQQLKKTEESGEDTGSITLTDKSDNDSDEEDEYTKQDDWEGGQEITLPTEEDDMGQESDVETNDEDEKYKVGDNVQLVQFFTNVDKQPVYNILEKNDEGHYKIQKNNIEGKDKDENTVSPAQWVKEDELSPFHPKSPGPLETQTSPFIIEEQKDDLEDVSSEDEDSDDEYNENMQKLEQDINTDYLYAHHPEIKQINYKELITLSNITRNKKGIIVDPLHKTIPFLTRYEKAKILGLRAKQINHGSLPFIDIPRDIIDGHTIAYMELTQNKIPFIIRRPLPNGGSEYWKISDLKNID